MVAMPPAKRRTGLDPLAYLGVEANTPPQFVLVARDPTQNDNGFNIGTIWLNSVLEDPWLLVNLNQRIATWIQFGGGGAGLLNVLTGDTGGTVFPDVSQNINIFGDPVVGLRVDGTPLNNTLTVTGVNGRRFGESLTGDVGAAAIFDAAGNIDIVGGANINTATPGGGSEVTVNLNDVIRWPNTNVAGTEGVIYLSGTSGAGGDHFMHNAGGDENTFLGILAGNLNITGVESVGIGNEALRHLSMGLNNTAVGSKAMQHAVSSNGSTAIGAFALQSEQTGIANISIGEFALSSMNGGGSFNIVIGQSSGTSYLTNESSNILINNAGTVAESNTIRIGDQGGGVQEQNRAFMAGIIGVTIGSPATVVVDTVTGQLGVGSSSPGVCGDNLFSAQQAETIDFPLTVPGIYRMGIPKVMTTVYDPDGVFFPGDGVAVPASFTAPADGFYYFNWQFQLATSGGTNDFVIQKVHSGFAINDVQSNAYNRRVNNFTTFGGGGGNIAYWSILSNLDTAIIQLSMGDTITFLMSFAGIINLGGFPGLNFVNGAQAATPAPVRIQGTGNFIQGYRIE